MRSRWEGSALQLIQGNDGAFYGLFWEGVVGTAYLFKTLVNGMTTVVSALPICGDLLNSGPRELMQGTDNWFYVTSFAAQGVFAEMYLDRVSVSGTRERIDFTHFVGSTLLTLPVQGSDGRVYYSRSVGGTEPPPQPTEIIGFSNGVKETVFTGDVFGRLVEAAPGRLITFLNNRASRPSIIEVPEAALSAPVITHWTQSASYPILESLFKGLRWHLVWVRTG